jgi:hypothetical protein
MSTGKDSETALAGQLIAGLKKHFSNTGSLAFGSGTFTPAQVETSLQAIIDLRAAVDVSKAATQAKIAAEVTQAPPLRSQMAAFVAFVKVTFAKSPDVLADFGLKPKKAPTPLTLDQKAAAAAKREATRAARHTMGKAQKKAVTGTITTIVTPAASKGTAPVAPSPVASAPSPGTSAAGSTPHAT